jgi:hypothetical protein
VYENPQNRCTEWARTGVRNGPEPSVAGSEYRIRSLEELTVSLAGAGFSISHTYGDWNRSPRSTASEDIVFVTRSH